MNEVKAMKAVKALKKSGYDASILAGTFEPPAVWISVYNPETGIEREFRLHDEEIKFLAQECE